MRKWIALALVFAVCGCQPVVPDNGDPVELGLVEEPAADGYVSTRRDGFGDGLPDLADLSSAQALDLAGVGVVNETVCNDCEKQQCRDVDGNDWYSYCFLDNDVVNDGPGKGSTFAALCLEVLRCARRTGCAAVDPEACYCGAGVSDTACLAQPAGPCTMEFEAAAESSHVDDVIARLPDPSYPVGAAFNLLRYCEVPICGASCGGGAGATDGGAMHDLATSAPDLATSAHDLATTGADLTGGVIPCADLDQNGKPDCDETLLRNSRFDGDLASWVAEYGATTTWQPAPDALGGSPSGSMVVANANVVSAVGTSMTGAAQCVHATTAANYFVAAQAKIAAGQGVGSAAVAVQFFPSPDCSGAATGAWSSPITSATIAWTTLSGSVAAPAATGSLRVRVVALKQFSAPSFQVQFDNVLLKAP
jgi:hypothetical protein